MYSFLSAVWEHSFPKKMEQESPEGNQLLIVMGESRSEARPKPLDHIPSFWVRWEPMRSRPPSPDNVWNCCLQPIVGKIKAKGGRIMVEF